MRVEKHTNKNGNEAVLWTRLQRVLSICPSRLVQSFMPRITVSVLVNPTKRVRMRILCFYSLDPLTSRRSTFLIFFISTVCLVSIPCGNAQSRLRTPQSSFINFLLSFSRFFFFFFHLSRSLSWKVFFSRRRFRGTQFWDVLTGLRFTQTYIHASFCCHLMMFSASVHMFTSSKGVSSHEYSLFTRPCHPLARSTPDGPFN